MPSPKPLTATVAATATDTTGAPQPVEFVGGIPAGSSTVRGGVKQGVHVADVTPAEDGTAAGTALNALLASLRAAGVIASS